MLCLAGVLNSNSHFGLPDRLEVVNLVVLFSNGINIFMGIWNSAVNFWPHFY